MLIPHTLAVLTGFCRATIDTVITTTRLVAFATEYESGVIRDITVNATMFCVKLKKASMKIKHNNQGGSSILSSSLMFHRDRSNAIQKGMVMKKQIWLSSFSKCRWWIFVSFITFLQKMFCREKLRVAKSAQLSPTTSNDSSVTVARTTPSTIGRSEQYIVHVCVSLNMILLRQTVKIGIDALIVCEYDKGIFAMLNCDDMEAKNLPTARGTSIQK